MSDFKTSKVKDWIKSYFTNGKFVCELGIHFLYFTFNGYNPSCIVKSFSVVTFDDYLAQKFFEPIGIGNAHLLLDPLGHTMVASSVMLTVDETFKIGFFA